MMRLFGLDGCKQNAWVVAESDSDLSRIEFRVETDLPLLGLWSTGRRRILTMTRLKPWPIIAGVLVDTLGSIVFGALYFLVVFGMQILRGTPQTDHGFSASYLVVTEVLGLLLTLLGGFVAARMARIRHIQHGIAVGIAALFVWSCVEWISAIEGIPVWYEIVSFVAVIPAAALGGYLAGMRADKAAAAGIGTSPDRTPQ